MEPAEPTSRWEQPPVWNGKAESWDDWERKVQLSTDFFDVKQAPALGPRLVRNLSHLPQAYVVGLSVPRMYLGEDTGVATLLAELWVSGLVRKVPTDIEAKLRSMPGQSMRWRTGSEGFMACSVRCNKCYRELGQALKRLANSLDASKLFHHTISGILLVDHSGLNGSDVGAVLTAQQNSYDYDRVMNGLEEQWPNHHLFQRDRNAKKTIQVHHGDGCPLEFSGDQEWRCHPDDESAWSFWPECDGWNTGWEDSSWDSVSFWSYEPEFSEPLPAMRDGNVDDMSLVPMSDDGEMQAAMVATWSASRTFTPWTC